MKLYAFISIIFLFSATTNKVLAQKEGLPNVIVIMADDLGYGDLSCYNDSSRIHTMNLDRLAAGGVQFLDAHSASAVCTPSRYALLTGRYPWRSKLKSGVLWAYDWPLIEPGMQTMASFFKKSGYRTAMTGKWHLGWRWPVKVGEQIDTVRFGGRSEEQTLERESKIDFQSAVSGGPLDCGFDYTFAVDIPSLPPFAFIENGRWSGGTPSVMKPESVSGAKGMMQEGWESSSMNSRIMDKAFEFIRGKSDEPFFLYLPLNLPHQPVAPSPEFSGTSAAGDYGDFVMEMDGYMGRLMSLLRDLGKYENTIVVFTSDNGSVNDAGDSKIKGADWARFGSGYAMFGHRSNGNWRGMKGDSWEGGHRVPLIVHWPAKVKSGLKSTHLVGLQDVFTTLVNLCGLNSGVGLTEDGIDFSPVLLGDKGFKGREGMVFHSSKGVLSVRMGKWKYIDCDYSGGSLFNPFIPNNQRVVTPGQLYDMENDPGEKINLFDDQPSVVSRLRAAIR
jgi:arylsulfatase A-like enzyme